MERPELKYPTIKDFFKGKCLFITGATGFMGKVLLEKLLRCNPEFDSIYLLLRPKRGQQPDQRLKDLLNGVVFERVRQDNPDVFSKLKVVPGDVSEEGLGIQKPIWDELKDKVSIVFHCAACVRFDMTLKYAITFNTLGTKRVLEKCKTIQNLECFVYVSTSYCHCDREVLEEKPYEPPADPHQVLALVTWMDDSLLQTLTPKLLGNLPNTYAYSKCLSEKLVTDAAVDMPVAIARPSIVTSAHKEPMPGFVDNLNGPTGLLLGAGKGVLRSMHCKPAYHADLIPVDLACNGLILTAWKLANTKREPNPLVVNLTAPPESRISWGEIIEMGRDIIQKHPFNGTVWYPDGSIKNSKLQHEICVVLFHIIPAYLIDALAVLFRHKPFMVNIQKRLQGGLDLLQYYTTKEWLFTSDKIIQINSQLSEQEQEIYNSDVTKVEWEPYFVDNILGTRKFILKDDVSTLPRARRNLRRLYWVDKIFRVLFYCFLAWCCFSIYEASNKFFFNPRATTINEPAGNIQNTPDIILT